MFKSEAYSAVTNINSKLRDTLKKDYHSYKFAQWFDNLFTKIFNDDKIVLNMENQHRLFHESIQKNMAILENGIDSLRINKNVVLTILIKQKNQA